MRSGAFPDIRTAVATKILSPHTIGLECPRPGTSTRHSTPESLPAVASAFQSARVGKPSAIPCAPGPRNPGQFCSVLEPNVPEASVIAGAAINEAVRNERRVKPFSFIYELLPF